MSLVILAAELQAVWALATWLLIMVSTLVSHGAWEWAIMPGLPLAFLYFALTFPLTLLGSWLIDRGVRTSRAAGGLAVAAFVLGWDLIGGILFGGDFGDFTSGPGLVFAFAASACAFALVRFRSHAAPSRDIRER